MSIRNLHFYNANETRSYPLDDAATAVSTQGNRLPNGILADLSIRYPRPLGDHPFLASITVNAAIVSITLQVAIDPTDPSTFTPLAVFTASRYAVNEGRHYALEPQYPGVGGWVVFGNGIDDNPFTGRFLPLAGRLAPRAARPYRQLPVQSLGRLYNATPLTGVVSVIGEEPVEVVKEQRTINGVLRDVAVVRLVQPITASTNVQVGQEINVFDEFTGPCGARPESQNCGDWSPIEAINAIPPDCDGNITIEFRGCATIAKVMQECGVVIDCGLGLTTACLPPHLPDRHGKLPNEYRDVCQSDVSQSISISDSAVGSHIHHHSAGHSQSIHVLGHLPYSETFDAGTARDWYTITGVFGYVSVDSPGDPTPTKSYSTETGAGPSLRNVALWEGFDHSTLHRQYTLDLMLRVGGINHNGGLVLNYKPTGDFTGRYSYFTVEIDYETQQFRLMFFNGSTWVPEPAFAALTSLIKNQWYRIVVTTTPSGSSVNIAAALYTVGGGGSLTLVATISEVTNKFMPDVGKVGFHANRAATRFAFLDVTEVF